MSLFRLLISRFRRRPVLRLRGLTDAEILASLDVPESHPVLQAVLELIERTKEECTDHATAAVPSDRDVTFYLGGRDALDQLATALATTRALAEQRGKSE